jgi:hypothetical protein
MINQLSDDQIQHVAHYIVTLFQEKNSEVPLTEEQQDLLDLLNDTIHTGRGDFAEHHDHYLYGAPKS